MVNEYPDWTLRQYQEYFQQHYQVSASQSTFCRHLQRLRWSLKKKLFGPHKPEVNESRKQPVEYWQGISKVAVDDLVFIDESGILLGIQRLVARAVAGGASLCPEAVLSGSESQYCRCDHPHRSLSLRDTERVV